MGCLKKILLLVGIGIAALVVFIALIGIVVLMTKWNDKKGAEYEQYTEAVYGKIQFKGKVLKVHKIPRWRRTYGIMCIKLDYTNTDSFYRFDNMDDIKMSCLKIKDSIVTLPIGFIGDEKDPNTYPILVAKYVEINLNNSKQMVFIDSMGHKYLRGLYYPSNNLIEQDMQLCDSCSANNAVKAKK